jgi:hypothetical protein
MAAPVSIPLLDHFAALSDPRQHAKVLYPLPEILLLVLAATIAGADDFVETTLWGTEHLRSSSAFTAMIAASPATTRCATCSRRWTRSCSKPVFWPGSKAYAMMTRTSSRLTERPRGAATTGGKAATPCTSSPPGRRDNGSCLASRRPRRSPTRSPPSRLLLKHLDLKGALVTVDAMGTQTDIAQAIGDGGGDYCLSLKKNWPAVYADVEQLFADPPDDVTFGTTETVDLTAGRIETRRHTVCHKVDWMTSDRHYPGEPPCSRTWP